MVRALACCWGAPNMEGAGEVVLPKREFKAGAREAPNIEGVEAAPNMEGVEAAPNMEGVEAA